MSPNVPNPPPNDPAAEAAAAHRRIYARRCIADVITITGRQIPAVFEESAAMLLAALWQASEPYGVEPSDWAAVAALPTSCLDVIAAVERRPRFEGES